MTTLDQAPPALAERITATTRIQDAAPKKPTYGTVAGVVALPHPEAGQGVYLVASNGHLMAVVHETQAYVDQPTILPLEVFSGRAPQKINRQGDLWINTKSAKAAPPVVGDYFQRFSEIMPDLEDGEDRVSITIDTAKLSQLAAAIGTDGVVTLHFRKEGFLGLPVPVSGNSGFGVIMLVNNDYANDNYATYRDAFVESQK